MSEPRQRLTSGLISLGIHIAILCISLAPFSTTISKSPIGDKQIPIRLTLSAPPKPVPKQEPKSKKGPPKSETVKNPEPLHKKEAIALKDEKAEDEPEIEKPVPESEDELIPTESIAVTENTVEDPKPTRLPGDRESPEIISKVTPIYPKSALNEDLSGIVTARFTIDKAGTPISYKIAQSSGHPVLDKTFARTVMLYYKFKPKRVLGKDTQGDVVLSYNFSLAQ